MNKRKAISILRKVQRFDIFDGKSRAERVSRRVIFLLLVLVIAMLSGHLYKAQQELKEPKTTIILVPEEQEAEVVEVDKVKEYIDSYGGRINDEYLATLRNYCDEETLKLVIAISVAETGMGTARMDLKTNWWGYHYGGNKKYDPDMETMSRVICNGIGKYYSDVATNYDRAYTYTGGDDTNTWIGNVNAALAEMR